MRAAKERKRMAAEDIPDEPKYVNQKLPKVKFATVSIVCGSERVTFRVFRFDAHRLVMRGKAQAASTIGKRVALVLDAVL